MKILLHSLTISNFKGIAFKTIEFGPETNIHGANGTGKTTIADAWYWLLFGKNSTDDTKFSIKNTVDTVLNKHDHEVQAVLDIDGERIEIRRVYREKWTKKRGRETDEYTGNEQLFYWNGVPLQLKEFQAKIASLLDEELFKKITNPHYFNMIPWQKRRETLIKMAGDVTLQHVAGTDKEFLLLLERLGKDSLEDYRKKLAARIAKLKDDLLHLPAIIKELRETLPEDAPNFEAIEHEIKILTDDLTDIDAALQNKNAAQRQFQDEQAGIQSAINKQQRDLADLKHKLTLQLQKADWESRQALEDAKLAIERVQASIMQLNRDKADAEKRIASYETTLASLREEWKTINAEKFEYPPFEWNDHDETCPTCKQNLPAATIDTRKASLLDAYTKAKTEKETSFNNSKARRLHDNKNAGVNANVSLANVKANLEQITGAIRAKESELATLQEKLTHLHAQYKEPAPLTERIAAALESNVDAAAIEATIADLTEKLKEEPAGDNADLKARKQEVVARLGELNKQLGQKAAIESTNARIEKLIADEKLLNQQRADAEREDNIRIRFEKARVELMVAQVNGLFQFVTFKLFKEQVNGGEEPTCETMLDGVPFTDLNTAGRIKAGIDIINALSKYYGVVAPIFLDNRESVTRIPETDSQVINLIVSPVDKKLRIESATKAEAAEAEQIVNTLFNS